MSEPQKNSKPSVAALRVAVKIDEVIPFETDDHIVAAIIDGEVAPLVEALRDLVAQVTSPDVDQFVEEEYVDAACAALAPWRRESELSFNDKGKEKEL